MAKLVQSLQELAIRAEEGSSVTQDLALKENSPETDELFAEMFEVLEQKEEERERARALNVGTY